MLLRACLWKVPKAPSRKGEGGEIGGWGSAASGALGLEPDAVQEERLLRKNRTTTAMTIQSAVRPIAHPKPRSSTQYGIAKAAKIPTTRTQISLVSAFMRFIDSNRRHRTTPL